LYKNIFDKKRDEDNEYYKNRIKNQKAFMNPKAMDKNFNTEHIKAMMKLRKIGENENVVLPQIKSSSDNPSVFDYHKYYNNTESVLRSGKDDESIANSENKVISIENKEVKKKSKNTKKIKFNLNNAPPKKRRNQTEIALSSNINKQKNKKNKKFIGSTNEISNIKLEAMSVNKLRNKKNRNKPLEKNEIRTFKDCDTKKNIRETEKQEVKTR